ncbi:putative quinol monooxygenase [Mucilaginibacter ginkgonis]|uniref:Antibiotic biosynthesis monooxygenase n=1 Tax=Mucilaginibacter ginkgonis TaxID=2682091 RepID=A0A7T7F8F3_9SPHI|nr:putative quinol monooxygenase [Mucilaginibacter ginkgonis]QQL48696.1 antibiotic biosynthesis monooxygenase [Mucilaginibacter ginkgonis]
MTAGIASAQTKDQITRIAKIEVDPAQLTSYTAALREQMNAAIKLEPGVLTYYAVADKLHPEKITILEIYASQAAYESHIQTAHFKKYKATVEHMVKSLELTNVDVVGIAKKPGL